MENNLSKAIKFPVRYDEEQARILDSRGYTIALLSMVKNNAFSHALAEMINGLDADSEMLFHECPQCNSRCNCSSQPCECCENGLDGRGNLQDLEKLRSIIEYCYGALFNVGGFGSYIKTVQEHLLQAKEIMSRLSINSKPDRQDGRGNLIAEMQNIRAQALSKQGRHSGLTEGYIEATACIGVIDHLLKFAEASKPDRQVKSAEGDFLTVLEESYQGHVTAFNSVDKTEFDKNVRSAVISEYEALIRAFKQRSRQVKSAEEKYEYTSSRVKDWNVPAIIERHAKEGWRLVGFFEGDAWFERKCHVMEIYAQQYK